MPMTNGHRGQSPALRWRSGQPPPTSPVGDVISYSYLLTNNGNVTLSGRSR